MCTQKLWNLQNIDIKLDGQVAVVLKSDPVLSSSHFCKIVNVIDHSSWFKSSISFQYINKKEQFYATALKW